jgi:NAD+ synthase
LSSPTQQSVDRLVSWIRGQVASANACGSVVGMSGGLDSSVVAVLCKLAFPDETLGLILPCHSIQTDLDHAHAVARKFQIRSELVCLDSAFDALLHLLPVDGGDPDTKRDAEANLKPRLRMATLYYYAARRHYLVVGASNKCELGLGYFTKHGDGGADILPLGNLVKSQVRSLARHLGIPPEIIDKPPSAGLWEGQTDEEEMGLTYEQLDLYFTNGEVGEPARMRIEERIGRNAHKRATPPVPPF